MLATVTIAFMTFFMLLEGPRWVESFFGLLAPESRRRWRAVGRDIYRTVGGYVTGQPADQPDRRNAHDDRPADYRRSVCAGARIDRRDPRPDPTRRRDDRSHHRRLGRVPPLGARGDHRRRLLHPLPAGREPHHPARDLRAHAAALAAGGADRRPDRRALAGVLGALAAIPVAGSLQVVFLDWLRHRRGEEPAGAT